jgi:ribosomal protein L37E
VGFVHEKRKAKSETEKEKQQHECSKCDYAAVTEFNLKRHIAFIHEKTGNRHKCSLCGYSASRRVYLRRHLNAVHDVMFAPVPESKIAKQPISPATVEFFTTLNDTVTTNG